MPIGKATHQTKNSVVTEITMVRFMRDQISSLTGLFQSKDWPKSPRSTMPLIHFQYWTIQGWSRP